MSDLLANDPAVDLASLTEAQIDWVVQRHVVYEVVQRIELDIGKTIVDNAPSPASAIDRIREMREYVEETVAASFRSHRTEGRPVSGAAVAKLTSSVIQETFSVFQEYVE